MSMMKEEEENAVTTSNGIMNEDYTTNIYSCSDSDNNRLGDGDGNVNLNQISQQVWGTWEELLLTCAVKRHGSKDWDSVAKEVGSRSSLNASAPNCRLKYQDLKRRFQDSVDDDDTERGNNEETVVKDDDDDDDDNIPWLEQLRSLRVAELRREVQRCDDSILSLQLKVKKLEEEKDGNDGDNKPDLDDDSKPIRSLHDQKLYRETTDSDHRSINESNSTASVDKTVDHERLLNRDITVQTNQNSRNPDPDLSRRSGMSHSSGTSTGDRNKRKGEKYYRSGEDSSIRGGSGGNIKSDVNKSQPLIEIIKLIRSHPRGSVFESRLRSQETKDYKRLIRQHLDIKTIEKKVEKGTYVSSSLSFYRDLKLLFTNAIVFFPSSSSESMAAQELRTLVSNEMKRKTGKSTHRVIKAEAESSVSRQKTSAPPLVACKKKSSPSKNTFHSSSSLKQKDEKKSQEVSEEKTVTTAARSSRRTSKGMEVATKDTKTGRAKNNNKKQKEPKTDSSNDDDDDDDDKEETHKTEKKTGVIASEKKKSVAEFLKRIKKNSPQKGKETTSKDQKKSDGNVKKENSKAKPRELRSNSTGKKKAEVENNSNKSPSKRKQSKKEAETAAATGKRGRESGKDNQQPKKRSRR